jgi:hypothetical protein
MIRALDMLGGISPPATPERTSRPVDVQSQPVCSMVAAVATPRRSKRLVTRNDLPHTPESLPRSSDRSESKFKIRKIRRRAEVEIVPGAKRVKKDVKVRLSDVKNADTDHGMVGPIGKIHLIQGM